MSIVLAPWQLSTLVFTSSIGIGADPRYPEVVIVDLVEVRLKHDFLSGAYMLEPRS